MKYKLKIVTFLTFLTFSLEAGAATVTSNTNTTAINFGKIAPGTATGNINMGNAGGCGTTTGGVKKISGCQNGSFSIQATTTAATNNGRRIRIFLTGPTSLTGTPSGTITSSFTITSPLPSGCTQITAGTVLQCTDTGGVGNVKTWTIPIYGSLSNIATNQATANYSGNYTLTACSCCVSGTPAACTNNGCPTSTADYKCTNVALFKTTSGAIPARIITALSIVENTQLQFGSVAASASSGTINQAGATTGGVTAVSGGITRSAGQFTVSGEATSGTPYSFTLPAAATLTGPGANMTATLAFSAGTGSRTLNASGQDVVNIDGTLTVNANQLAGNYTGTYSVTVNY